MQMMQNNCQNSGHLKDGDEPGVFSPSRSPHSLVQAKKKKKVSMYFYLLKSKCPRDAYIPTSSYDLQTQVFIISREKGALIICHSAPPAGVGQGHVTVQGSPHRRSWEPDHLSSPAFGHLCLLTALPFILKRRANIIFIASRVCFLLTTLPYLSFTLVNS